MSPSLPHGSACRILMGKSLWSASRYVMHYPIRCNALYYIPIYYYCALYYTTVLHCTALQCTVLYCTTLYHTNITILHTLLHCTILYYTMYYLLYTPGAGAGRQAVHSRQERLLPVCFAVHTCIIDILYTYIRTHLHYTCTYALYHISVPLCVVMVSYGCWYYYQLYILY